MTGSIPGGTNRWLWVPVLLLLPLTALSVHLFGFRRMYALAGRLAWLASKWLSPPHNPIIKAEQIAHTVILTNRRLSFYQANCLAESLVLWAVLNGSGIKARFCMGVRTITGPLDAHAWVRHGDSILNEIPSVESIYAVFDLDRLAAGARVK